MAQVLFSLNILCTIGMLVVPITSAARGSAVYGWLSQLGGSAGFSILIGEYFPSWEEPQWHSGIIWALASWALFITGFIVAIRKPRKRNTTVA